MTELIDNPPPLPAPAKKEPWQTAANGKWISGVNIFYTADQYRAGEAAAFARGVAAGRNAGLEEAAKHFCAKGHGREMFVGAIEDEIRSLKR